MMTTSVMIDYLKVLFDPEDHICISQSVFSNHTRSTVDVINTLKNYEFVSINPFTPGTTRAARNVCKYRNFIIEFEADSKGVPLDEQRATIDKLGLPFSTQVFSGSKSMHFVISLETPLASAAEWEKLSGWLYNIMKPYKVDPKCCDIGRFTRVGGGFRVSKQSAQELIECRSRIPNQAFIAWLEKSGSPPPPPKTRYVSKNTAHHMSLFGAKFDDNFRGKITKETIEFIKTGGDQGDRHYKLFKAACDLRDQRYPVEEAKVLLLTKLRERYIIESKEGEMWRNENTVADAYNNYKPNPPRF